MPVEAPFRQSGLLHHCPDAAAVPAVLAQRARRHDKNVLVVPRFVFRRISHRLRVRSYSNLGQYELLFLLTPIAATRNKSSCVGGANLSIYAVLFHAGHVCRANNLVTSTRTS